MSDDLPPYYHPGRDWWANRHGSRYEAFPGLDEARACPTAVAVLDSDGYGILATCPVRRIATDGATLLRLTRELWEILREGRKSWEPAPSEEVSIYYEATTPELDYRLWEGIEVVDGLSLHPDLHELGLAQATADVIGGKSPRLGSDALDRIARRRAWFDAVERDDVEAVGRFLAEGFDVDTRKELVTWTALASAAFAGGVAMVRLLLEHGADPNARDDTGQTPMTRAAIRSQGRFVRAPDARPLEMLLAAGGRIGLLEAVLLKDVESARKACEADPSLDVSGDARFSYHDTYLMEAAGGGDLAMVEFLLDRGADIEGTDDLGATALMRAAARGHAEVVALLLDRGADVDHDDSSDQTPLSEAATNGHREICELLLSRGAGRSLLDAVALDDVDLVAQLLRDGADPNHVYYGTGRLVMYAVSRGCAEIVRLLLEHGAALDDSSGKHSLLAEAAAHGHDEVARLLIERGAGPKPPAGTA